MGSIARLACAACLAGLVGACAAVTGLDAFTKGNCPGDCDASTNSPADEAGSDEGATETSGAGTDDAADAEVASEWGIADGTANSDASDVTTDSLAPGSMDAASDVVVTDGGASGKSYCDGAACPVSEASQYACPAGGCSGGTCSAVGLTCYCVTDSQCISGKCVAVKGQNDVACGSRCTGTGEVDGFDCLLASPGIPAVQRSNFGYAPSNFLPANFTPPATGTTIDCNTTYNTTTHAFTGWCAGQTPPNVHADVAQTGGPSVDVLAFASLTVKTTGVLNVVSAGGGNAVILAVYGNAQIQGAIHADGQDGASGGSAAGASGPGGAFNCGLSAGTSQPADGRCSAGAGGGASAAGGAGAGGVGGNAALGGVARPNPSISPLFGGCPGGLSGTWACRTSGGGGGGAIQISAAGLLSWSGTITANGGNGGTSKCFMAGCSVPFGTGFGGGGGGAGSGGAVLVEAQSVMTAGGSGYVNGGRGGDPNTTGGGGTGPGGTGGNGGTILSTSGASGTGSSMLQCASYTQCGGGGGGGYGYFSVHAADSSPCATNLSPAPVLNAAQTACTCVADSNCSSGRCVASRCDAGSCSGVGPGDLVGCQIVSSVESGWACPVGNCKDVTAPGSKCSASGMACWCTDNSECPTGRCVGWAGCPPGSCSGAGAFDAFHCAL